MISWFESSLGYDWAFFLATIIDILVIALPLMLAVAMIIYAGRKIWAAMALRRGPNVVGPFGLLQSFADGLKGFLQETIVPAAANRTLFLLAPIITFTVALIVWAVCRSGSVSSSRTSTSGCSTCSRPRRSACTGSSCRAGRRTPNIRSTPRCVPRRRWSVTKSRSGSC